MNNIVKISIAALMMSATMVSPAQRTEILLKEGWKFTKGVGDATTQWQNVTVPHDWAVYGPFDRNNDLQIVAIEQNNEVEKTVKTGRTGGLPFIGKGEYRTTFEVPDTVGRSVTLVFDGAMSNAHVTLNGKEVAFWPYGYNSFYVNVDGVVRPGKNELQVNLENYEKASRWYPGAGLYRNVHVVTTDKVHIPTWGTYITTPVVKSEYASVNIETTIAGAGKGQNIEVATEVKDASGNVVASTTSIHHHHGQAESQNILLECPNLWSPESPYLYTATTRLLVNGKEVDSYDTRFGVRTIEYIPEKGFFLNGVSTKFKGVCNHHDLGALGAAVNKSAIRYQLELLKDMGCNAIRTAHNMPAPELMELCDEMGFMTIVETFDDWGFRPKSQNGYGSIFKEWAEKDVTNMIVHYRNSPSVVMWSIGNEVPSQWGPDGVNELVMLQNWAHRLDPTRPVTCGMDQIGSILDNGFAASIDIPGFNYKPQYYATAHDKLPQKYFYASESASTVSSRGVYHFPVIWEEHYSVVADDHQSSSYDNESCTWSNTPDIDFAMDEDCDYVMGQFVWTGFDYLGEPSPYDTDAWPNHSSVFGIIDLAWLPKDRFYLYRSIWNKDEETLHVLPHWNWKGREGEVTPVFVYTNYPKAELFVNGRSQGVREKNDSTYTHRYRLMWNEVRYEPGEVKVVAYDKAGNKAAEKIVRTAGKPHHLVVTPNRSTAKADGDDLIYFTVQVADKDGNIVPTDNRQVYYTVEGEGEFLATTNGDPTCVMSFQEPTMKLFSGAATVIAKTSKTPGKMTITVKAKGVKNGVATIDIE